MRPSVRAVVGLAAVVVLAGCGGAAQDAGPPPGPTPTVTSAAPTAAPTTTPTASPTASPTRSPTPSPAPSRTTSPTPAPTHRTSTALRRGAHGPAVLALEQRLSSLGYWLGTPDETFGRLTTQAVYALQKAAGLSRDGVVGPATRRALTRGVVPSPRSRSGRVVEIDLERLLMVVVDGRLVTVLNASTGSGRTYWVDGEARVAVTPRGTFAVYAQIDGMRHSDLGYLWRPKYFHGGIAIHGYDAVPPYPASHGCVRVTDQAMNRIFSEGLVPLGTQVRVY